MPDSTPLSSTPWRLPSAGWLMACSFLVGSLLGMLTLAVSATPTADAALSAGLTAPPPTVFTDAQCLRCHQVDAAFSHPVDRAPTMAMPAGMPLTNGKITCVTCHQDTAAAHAEARKTHNKLLRGGLDAPHFCMQCHDAAQTTRATQHGAALGKAHLRWPARREPRPLTTPHAAAAAPIQQHDAESRTCMACHDGSVASDHGPTNRARGETAIGKGHPTGVPYMNRRDARGRTTADMPLRPAAALDSSIRLFDGNVGCGSCHSPYSQEPALLVMSNDRSKLCLSCHVDR